MHDEDAKASVTVQIHDTHPRDVGLICDWQLYLWHTGIEQMNNLRLKVSCWEPSIYQANVNLGYLITRLFWI